MLCVGTILSFVTVTCIRKSPIARDIQSLLQRHAYQEHASHTCTLFLFEENFGLGQHMSVVLRLGRSDAHFARAPDTVQGAVSRQDAVLCWTETSAVMAPLTFALNIRPCRVVMYTSEVTPLQGTHHFRGYNTGCHARQNWQGKIACLLSVFNASCPPMRPRACISTHIAWLP